MRKAILLFLAIGGLSRAGDFKTRFEQIAQARVAKKAFMGTVLVAKGDQILFDKAYGSANLEWDVPNAPSTKFRLGSVTKQFTAASILLLEERGKLKTDDAVKKWVPNAPAAWDKITLFHLLTHTSGIPNFTSFPEYADLQLKSTTPEKLVATFRDKPLDFEPGSKWSYSNSGYLLLGYIIEKASGQTYQQFVDDNIFRPLEMKDSGYDSNSQIIVHRASGYMPSPSGPINASYIDMTVPFAAGGLYSTTHDLLKWVTALNGCKLLSPASLNKMTTPYKNDYGFGVSISTISGHKRIEHGGGIQGFNSEVVYWPEDKLTVVVLANLNGSAPADIASDLAATLHGESVVLANEHKEITLTPDQMKPFVGRYEIAPEMYNDVSLEGDHLETQLTGQPKLPMFAQSPTSFFLKVVEARVDFTRDAQGKVTQLTIYQGGRETVAKKISDTVPAPPVHKEIVLSPDALKAYVGTYALAPTFELTITLEGDHLEVQATNQPKFPIYAEAPDRFFLKVVEAQLEFGRDAGGQVTQLTLHQAGHDTTGKKK